MESNFSLYPGSFCSFADWGECALNFSSRVSERAPMRLTGVVYPPVCQTT